MSHIVSLPSTCLRVLRTSSSSSTAAKFLSSSHPHQTTATISFSTTLLYRPGQHTFSTLSTFSSPRFNLSTSTRRALSEQALSDGSSSLFADKNSSNRFGFTRRFHTSPIRYATISVAAPSFPESIKEGTIRLLKKVGDKVALDETVAEIETDKTNLNVNAPQAGVIESASVEDGANVTSGAEVYKISTDGAGTEEKVTKKEDKPKPAIGEGGRRKATDEVDAERMKEPSKAPDSSPKLDSALKKSQEEHHEQAPSRMPSVPPLPKGPTKETPTSQIPVTPAKAPQALQSVPGVDPQKITGTRSETRVKMSRMRIKIAERLKEAQNTCAMLTTFNEIDMSNIVEFRKKYADQFLKRHNIKLGFMSAFVKASACALMDNPVVNAVVDGNEIVYRDYIDISVAVATPKGLVVPVLRNVERMNYADIERTINEFGDKAKKGTMSIEDMDGGTFTISNGGVFGSLFGTPIINPPQSAILGMHAIFDRPVAVNGKIEIHPMMYVALTYDHRILDGRDAVLFLRKIKQNVEDSRAIFLDI